MAKNCNICARYVAGEGIGALASAFHISRENVSNHLRKYGIEIRRPGRPSKRSHKVRVAA